MGRKKFFSKVLAGVLSISMLISPINKNVFADSFNVVTLGADLSDDQKDKMLEYFGVKENDALILEITSKEEYEYLGELASKDQLGTRSISCSFVEPTNKGGLEVSVENITWVSEGMIRNALITAGIENANVKVSAPFKVSGTAALTGILKGFENSESGEEIEEDKKEAANEEIIVTGELGEKIGQDEAAQLINDIKKDVIKEKPETPKEVEKIVSDASKDFEEQLSQEDMEKVTELMDKINKLELDFSKLKDSLNDAADKLKDALNSEEAQNFFGKVKEFFSNLFESIGDFFSGAWDFISNLFSDDTVVDENTDTTNNPTESTSNENTSNGNSSVENNDSKNNSSDDSVKNNESVKDNDSTENSANSTENNSDSTTEKSGEDTTSQENGSTTQNNNKEVDENTNSNTSVK